MVRVGAVLAAVGVLVISTPLDDMVGALSVLGGLAALVGGVLLLGLGLVASKRGWAFLVLVGVCVYGVALMLPLPGRHGGVERACAQWLSDTASPQVRAAIAVNPEAGWANSPAGVGRSFLPAGRTCTFTPPGMARVMLTPSWTLSAVAGALIGVAALGGGLSRSRRLRGEAPLLTADERQRPTRSPGESGGAG